VAENQFAMELKHMILLLTVLLYCGRAFAMDPQACPRGSNLPDKELASHASSNTNRYLIRSGNGHSMRANSKAVVVKGTLLIPDDRTDDVVLLVEVDGGTLLHAQLRRNGRFSIHLPADVRARLYFQKPGHGVKEIWLDTRNAHSGERRLERRNVAFDVVLVKLTESSGGQGAEGPEGRIAFLAGTGAMRVHYREGALIGQLEPRRQFTIPFRFR
jgi:hypothetical protein